MANRKLSDEPDISFVHEAPWCSEETKTISVKIKEFTKKMNDPEHKDKLIESPAFTMAGKKLSIGVKPWGGEQSGEGFVSVFLCNPGKKSIKVTANFKASCGIDESLKIGTMKNREIPSSQMLGFRTFFSHSAFEKWAEENEDVFSLEVTVTLRIQGASNWTTER